MVRLEPPAELNMPIGEAMFSQRAIRRLDRDRPIDDAQLKIVLDAASKAPSGGNTQGARYLVVRDRQRIAEFGDLYYEAWWPSARTTTAGRPGRTSRPIRPTGWRRCWRARCAHAPVVILTYSTGGAVENSVFPGARTFSWRQGRSVSVRC